MQFVSRLNKLYAVGLLPFLRKLLLVKKNVDKEVKDKSAPGCLPAQNICTMFRCRYVARSLSNCACSVDLKEHFLYLGLQIHTRIKKLRGW